MSAFKWSHFCKVAVSWWKSGGYENIIVVMGWKNETGPQMWIVYNHQKTFKCNTTDNLNTVMHKKMNHIELTCSFSYEHNNYGV